MSVHVPLQAVTMENAVLGWPVIAMIPGCAVYTHDHDCGAKRKALLIAMISCKMIENSRKFGPRQTCNQTDIYLIPWSTPSASTISPGARRIPIVFQLLCIESH